MKSYKSNNNNSKSNNNKLNNIRGNNNWYDDPIEIETRDADSIKSDSKVVSSEVNKKNKPKLYTFYDYINKKKEAENPIDNQQQLEPRNNYNNNNQHNNKHYSPSRAYERRPIRSEYHQPNHYERERTPPLTPPTPEPKYSNRSHRRVSSPFELEYVTMPISSGFGGYTNTTRRKVYL
jgi:hypothetical protein